MQRVTNQKETLAQKFKPYICTKRIWYVQKKNRTAALKVDAVQSAVWKEDTKKLSVKCSVHKPEAIDEVEKKISTVGHDAGKLKATEAAYKSLPECCNIVVNNKQPKSRFNG